MFFALESLNVFEIALAKESMKEAFEDRHKIPNMIRFNDRLLPMLFNIDKVFKLPNRPLVAEPTDWQSVIKLLGTYKKKEKWNLRIQIQVF